MLAMAFTACDSESGAEEGEEGEGEAAPASARGVEGGDGISEGRSAIVGGDLEPGRSAVVALMWREPLLGEMLVCSGVLITPTIVVTAAHCLHPHVTGIPADELIVVFGSDVATSTDRIAVASGAYSPLWRPDDPESASDIGAVRLSAVAPVDPIAIGPSPVQGGQVVLVGYGAASLDADAAMGVKRSGNALVGEVTETSFKVVRAPSTTCSGDSGGATLADVHGAEVLLGIHSRGDCVSESWNERIDMHANGFLREFMADFGSCNADGACAVGCPDPDPDCPCDADGICNASCAAGQDTDCTGPPCQEPPPEGSDKACCDDGACEEAASEAGRAGWGSAGCSVPWAVSGAPTSASGPTSPTAPASILALLGLAAISRASRRRSRRAGSSRSGS